MSQNRIPSLDISSGSPHTTASAQIPEDLEPQLKTYLQEDIESQMKTQLQEDIEPQMKTQLQENVISGWIGLNGTLKNSRVTKDMSFNEAILMRIVWNRYRHDGVGRTQVQQIIRETHMLKSIANRTINTLCDKGYLIRQKDENNGRNLIVVPVPAKLPEFLAVHNSSLALAQSVIDIIGIEDAEAFVRVCQKISNSGLAL